MGRVKRAVPGSLYEAAVTAMGAGDDALTLWMLLISTSAPLLLLLPLLASGPFGLFSLLLLLSAEGAPDSSLTGSGTFFGGALHRETSHTTPVKLLTLKPPIAHLRQGFPDLSSARRPALMAPWFAFGPSLWPPPARFAAGSMVPSSLPCVLEYSIQKSGIHQLERLAGNKSHETW